MRVAIVGASGYAGGELLRLLLRHPGVTVQNIVSETCAGQPVRAVFPGMRQAMDRVFVAYGDGAEVFECDVVFLAQENGKAMQRVPDLLARGCRVIDLSADFRLRSAEAYERWYGLSHGAPHLLESAVYGLPELYAERIRSARLIANPGCYPTASILGLAPLVQQRWIDLQTLVVDAKSGVSGAGRARYSAEYHYPERNDSVAAYKIAGAHRHTPEIEQVLSEVAGESVPVSFTPHLIPMSRGIMATCYAVLQRETSTSELLEAYRAFYARAPFVEVREALPETKHVSGSNACHISLGVDVRTRRVTVVSVIDNLIKGAAGQAIQNMNLMCGFPETEGLEDGGMWP
ncbi:MAG: N-acetyl-gamma-glutamyl-phosphate reductase [Chloroherpetonaceae bacterium]|nr:N-acetyl-gamma-glutamyl-phosphate reductase [Chthonomonadaceae bacterium]MDW8208963.1 N-acetyl-gamma-glutamyl-phosphate reductase [Chloroherpetonaceae bacterium]